MPRTTRLFFAIAALLCAALIGVGCSEKESGIGAGQKPAEKRQAKKPAAQAAPQGEGTPVAKATGTPKIVSPKGPAPKTLQTLDLKVGKGAPVKAGQQLQVNYAGALYGSGKQFDSSFGRGQTLPVQLGAGSVIPGFDRGLVGMRVGGRRQIIIPPDLGYGPQGQGPIPANSTLIFVIDLMSAGPAGQGGGAAAP